MKLDAFNDNCPQRIFKIVWPNQITNEELWNQIQTSHNIGLEKKAILLGTYTMHGAGQDP